MADTFDAATRSWIMSRVKGQGTEPERIAAAAFREHGLRFSRHRKTLPGRPDFAFARQAVAVFVNGCFWHWHGCPRCRMPKSNRGYWRGKINRNVERDKMIRSRLHQLGWRYVTVWECNFNQGVRRAIRLVRNLGPG